MALTALGIRPSWLALGLLLVLGTPASAEFPPGTGATAERWGTEQAAGDGADPARPVAVVGSASRDTLRVYRDKAGDAQLGLRLRAGMERLWQDACPTVQVDSDPPRAPLLAAGGCTVQARGARIALGSLRGGGPGAVLLRRLMHGTEVTLRFRLQGLGYREARFTLLGSRQALAAAIGAGAITPSD